MGAMSTCFTEINTPHKKTNSDYSCEQQVTGKVRNRKQEWKFAPKSAHAETTRNSLLLCSQIEQQMTHMSLILFRSRNRKKWRIVQKSTQPIHNQINWPSLHPLIHLVTIGLHHCYDKIQYRSRPSTQIQTVQVTDQQAIFDKQTSVRLELVKRVIGAVVSDNSINVQLKWACYEIMAYSLLMSHSCYPSEC